MKIQTGWITAVLVWLLASLAAAGPYSPAPGFPGDTDSTAVYYTDIPASSDPNSWATGIVVERGYVDISHPEMGLVTHGSESDAKAEKILARLAEARSLVDQGDLDSARELVDEAYETAKFAVEDLREGETVVRSLHFESAEEEYRYELGRNDTHVLLFKVLLDEKRQSQGVDSMVKKFMERSRTLRTQAEGEAEVGKFRQAISTLEDSTKELLRAIRSTGVYIPG